MKDDTIFGKNCYIACLFRVKFQTESSGYLEPMLLFSGNLEETKFNVYGKKYASQNTHDICKLNDTFIYGFPLDILDYIKTQYQKENRNIDVMKEKEIEDKFLKYYDTYYEKVYQEYQLLIMKNAYNFYIDEHKNIHVVQFDFKNKECMEVNLLESYYQDRISSKIMVYPGR